MTFGVKDICFPQIGRTSFPRDWSTPYMLSTPLL